MGEKESVIISGVPLQKGHFRRSHSIQFLREAYKTVMQWLVDKGALLVLIVV